MTHNHTPRGSTMKCIRPRVPGGHPDARTIRVRNAEAAIKVATGEWHYTTKSAYRAQERTHNVVTP